MSAPLAIQSRTPIMRYAAFSAKHLYLKLIGSLQARHHRATAGPLGAAQRARTTAATAAANTRGSGGGGGGREPAASLSALAASSRASREAAPAVSPRAQVTVSPAQSVYQMWTAELNRQWTCFESL